MQIKFITLFVFLSGFLQVSAAESSDSITVVAQQDTLKKRPGLFTRIINYFGDANKEKPERPDVAFWFPPADLTNAAFLQNAMALEKQGGRTQYLNLPEVEMADRTMAIFLDSSAFSSFTDRIISRPTTVVPYSLRMMSSIS